MLPIIEFWDIDLIDAPEPVFVLGTSESMTKDITKKKKLKKSKKLMVSYNFFLIATNHKLVYF